MHQQSRYPPRGSSPASSPQTNPTRTNNPRDAIGAGNRSRAASSAGGGGQDGGVGSLDPQDASASGPSRESVKKLDQIVQNFHTKAAVLILQSRVNTTVAGSKKSDGRKTKNKWFQIETDEIDDFREELRVWRTCGSYENRPPPMVIETYLDASALSSSQTLIATDENGKPWDVLDALNSYETSSDGSSSSRSRKRHTEVVLERFRIELKSLPSDDTEDFGPTLPTIYKRSIVFFRSLFVTTRILPAWKHSQQILSKGGHSALQVHCRFSFGDVDDGGYDLLRQPLFDGRDAVTDYVFGELEVPVGRIYASVTYRNDCKFRVDDSETLLSSRFMGMGVDDQLFKPSLPQRHAGRRDSYTDMSSVPSRRHDRPQPEQQTYGSLSTFHGAGPLGTSPLSALKAVRPIASDTSSPSESTLLAADPEPHSLPVHGQTSITRPGLRNFEGTGRRPSVSFQPFKAGSLSGSPRINDGEPPASPHSLARQSALGSLQQSRNRNSLTAGMAASLRGAPLASLDTTGSPSSKPASRYSSSFTHRRGRPSFGGASKAGDDDQGSSGKQSLSSSVQPGSGLLAEAVGSSGSVQTDDDNISEFLKILDSKKTLQSFEPSSRRGATAARNTVAQLSKFALMRESNNALGDSMHSSVQFQHSSSSSSRQLTSVPGMVNPASLSASSSPSKPLSPHTPHTPAVPSRLSEAAIIDHQAQQLAQPAVHRASAAATAAVESATRDGPSGGSSGAAAPDSRQEGTTAIDIPLSPRLLQTNRRASSVAQQHRALIVDDDDVLADMPFASNRSLSLGAADSGEPPTMRSLLGRETESGDDVPPLPLRPAAEIRPSSSIITGGGARSASSTDQEDGSKNPSAALLSANTASSSPGGKFKLRYSGAAVGAASRGRPAAPAHSSSYSRGGGGGRHGSGSAGGRSTRAGAGAGAGDNEADDEPLLFDMSELEQKQGRRSLEESRGGPLGGRSSGSGDRGGYDSSRGARRGW